MKPIQAACYSLIASACILAAALFTTLSNKNQSLDSAARADMVVQTNNLAFLTTRTNANEEALFVLDNTAGRLMIYKTDLGRKRIEFVESQDLKKLFNIVPEK